MTRGRLASQLQSDQVDLFRLQNQLSTGFRIFLPSDDAPAAQRAMVLQRTIERKEQSLTSLKGAENGLNTTWSGLGTAGNLLNDIKSTALGAVGTFSSQEERDALVSEINLALTAIQNAGNTTFTSTYLVGGAERSSEAYEAVRGYIEYLGDESTPRTFVDIGQLFDSGTSGHDALGGFSDSVRGAVDLNRQLTPDTRLSKLNGGLGVSPNGSIEVTFKPASPSASSTSAVIDLSNAKTIKDVVRLVEAGAPEDSGLTVSVEGNALRIDAVDGGVTVSEAFNGQTARELGIITSGTAAASVTGTDLNPTIDRTDRLDDLGGSKARGRIVSPGANNDLVLTANENGAQYNGVTVNYVGGASPGSEVATYDDLTNTLTVTITDGESNAIEIAKAINDNPSVPFTAELDYRDQTAFSARGTGSSIASPALSPDDLTVSVAGGADGGIDLSAGFLVTNGDETYTIDTSGAETVEDLLSELNRPLYGLAATINSAGDGIDVRTRRSGADFAIAENGGTTAADLGIRTYTDDSRLDDFNRGVGVLVEGISEADTLIQNPFTIVVTEDGQTDEYTIDPRGLETVDDLLQQISSDTLGAVAATLKTVGNGIALNVTDPDSPAVPASGSFGLGADTLTITSDSTGASGNRPFTVEVIDSGGTGPLQTTIAGDTITVDLQGVPATTDAIASGVQGQLPGFSVSSVAGGGSFDTISAAVGPIAAATTNGAAASNLAAVATGEFTLNGDDITLTAAATGVAGNLPLAVQVVDSGGTGPLATSFDPDTGTITVDLQGVDTTTDAIAQSIQDLFSDIDDDLPDFTVVSSGTTAIATTDVPGLLPFDATTSGGQAIDSITVSGSYAERLGFIPAGEESVTSTEGELTSTDRNTREVDSVFTTLIRMRDALEAGDDETFEREVNRLETDIDRVTFSRAEIGTRLENLDAIKDRLADEDVSLRAALSEEIEADLVDVISEFTAKQAALQASLQISGTLLNLSILDFI